MIKLGHIEYSNCFPVHARFLSEPLPAGIEIVRGIPSFLNGLLENAAIDVAPSSSIEYARHADRYRLLPDFVIGSDGAVGSILFESTKPIEQLDGALVRVPTASATSVVLLQILLKFKYALNARFEWFTQNDAADPIAAGADAALWIGDVALRRKFVAERNVTDLGAEWKNWTGLPFVFAAWQTPLPPVRNQELRDLLAALHRSREYFTANAARLARENAALFGVESGKLLTYWQSLRYTFDAPMQRGLLKYYELAAELGGLPAVTELHWVT
jgi:chorismate dehydratase